MKRQREFPWLAMAKAPEKAAPRLVSLVQSEAEAMRVCVRMALTSAGRRISDAEAARALGVSRSYLSEMMAGTKRVPEWVDKPLAYLCGSWLLTQYRALAEALNDEAETPKARAERLAREFGRAA